MGYPYTYMYLLNGGISHGIGTCYPKQQISACSVPKKIQPIKNSLLERALLYICLNVQLGPYEIKKNISSDIHIKVLNKYSLYYRHGYAQVMLHFLHNYYSQCCIGYLTVSNTAAS